VDWSNISNYEELFSTERALSLLQAGFTLILGFVVARLAARGIDKALQKRVNPQQTMLAKRLTFYGVMSLVLISFLGQLGVDLSVLLGAAGILTIAIGFASQTSASNLVSGLFLMAEQPFVVGDWIQIDDVVGTVLAVDLLAVRIRLFDNTMVRIPNENIIKSRLTNLTRFPIRRADINVGVAYKEDMERVKSLMFDLADRHPLVLDDPKPQFFFDGYGDSALDLRLCVWTAKENIVDVRNAIRLQIKEVFDREGIEIPFPHRSLYAGSVTDPFPVHVVELGKNSRQP
jgi:small-conductance mechanosensitive channel